MIRRHFPILLCLAVPLLSGCAKGMFWRVGGLTPWVQRQWAEEEKRYGATLRTKLSDLEELVRMAPSMSPQERESWATQLAHLANSDPSPLLRARVVEALPAFPAPVSDSAMQVALRDEDVEVRVAACEALGKRGGTASLELLSRELQNDQDPDVRLAAIRGLGHVTSKQDVPEAMHALGVALDDKNPAIQYRAIDSLRRISGRDYGTSVEAWRELAQGREPKQPQLSFFERVRNWF